MLAKKSTDEATLKVNLPTTQGTAAHLRALTRAVAL
jgi:hypothetical protein